MAWRHRTNQGRVIYRRKPKYFTCTDLLRITQRIIDANSFWEINQRWDCFIGLFKIIYKLMHRVAETYDRLDELDDIIDNLDQVLKEEPEPSGYGGAGATREVK